MKDHVTSIGKLLRLVDGKFMRGDVEIKPEIGNPNKSRFCRRSSANVHNGKRMPMMAGWMYTFMWKILSTKSFVSSRAFAEIKFRRGALIILTFGKIWKTLFMRMGQSSAINATGSMRLMVYMQS